MDDSLKIDIYVDLGFTRFKLDAFIGDSLISSESYYIKDLSNASTFFLHHDFLVLKEVFINFLRSLPFASCISIHPSSQMHCLACDLDIVGHFLSTWNDLPLKITDSSCVGISDGIPLLSSMPANKVSYSNGALRASSSAIYSCFSAKELTINSLASPITLILSGLFNKPLPCHRSWWQSTCLDSHLVSNLSSTTYLSSSSLELANPSGTANLLAGGYLLMHPEIGDLQASTQDVIDTTDIIINIGTGSQVIFALSTDTSQVPYYRYYPDRNDRLSVISHIPCGRLLQTYSSLCQVSFDSIAEELKDLDPNEVKDIGANYGHSLLFFPGYCAYAHKYSGIPLISADHLVNLDLKTLLSCWIYQYPAIINSYCNQSTTNKPLTITVTGNLGGLGESFCSILSNLMSKSIRVDHAT